MAIVQIAAELGEDDRLTRREFGYARVGFINLKPQRFEPFVGAGRKRSISAECDPVVIIIAWKIIFERVPFRFGLVVPVDMPDPRQIVCALSAHQIDNVAVGRDVTLRAFTLAAIPFPVPTEPVPVRFGPPLNQYWRTECFGVARPGAKIDIELAGDNFLKRKRFLAMLLIDIRPRHQAHVRNLTEMSAPLAHRASY